MCSSTLFFYRYIELEKQLQASRALPFAQRGRGKGVRVGLGLGERAIRDSDKRGEHDS